MSQKNCILKFLVVLIISIFFIGCGGGGGASTSPTSTSKNGIFIDDVVQGLKYKTKGIEGFTNEKGEFPYFDAKVEFFIGNVKIGEITTLNSDNKVFIQDLFNIDRASITDERVVKIATFLQSLDSDNNTDKIEITLNDFNQYNDVNGSLLEHDTKVLLESKGYTEKSISKVREHLIKSHAKNNKAKFDRKEKDFLYDSLKNRYLWSDKVANGSYNHYINPNKMINNFKYGYKDKWSYAETFESYYKDAAQEDSGFGCYFNQTTYIHFMDFNSPCDKAGLQRGDELVKINNNNVTTESYNAARLNNGKEVIFTVLRNGKELNLRITPNNYTYKASKYMLFTSSDNKKIAYFIYNTFSSRSTEEIDEAFSYFQSEKVDELIVDLRFNGGGSLNTASYLIDKIAAFNHEGKVQYFEKYAPTNEIKTQKFIKADNSIDLSRVFFLTSENTASASELVINSLKPHMDVKVIGSKTSGKPVGMTGQYTSSNYLYWLINLSFYNADNDGEYFNGLDVDCKISDNMNIPINDVTEHLLGGAIFYIENEVCLNVNQDTDNDNIPDYIDSDDDNDGILDSKDFNPFNSKCHKESEGNGEKCYKEILENGNYNGSNIFVGSENNYIFVKKDFFNVDENLIINFDLKNSTTINTVEIRHSFNSVITSTSYAKKENIFFLTYSDGVVTKIDFKEANPSEKEFLKISSSSTKILATKPYVFITYDKKLYIYNHDGKLLNTQDSLNISDSTSMVWSTENNTLITLGSGEYNYTMLESYTFTPFTGEVLSKIKKRAISYSERKENLIIIPNKNELLLYGKYVFDRTDLLWKNTLSNNYSIVLIDNDFILGSTYSVGSSDSPIFLYDKDFNVVAEDIFNGSIINIKKVENNTYELLIEDNYKISTKIWNPVHLQPTQTIEVSNNLNCDLNCFINSIDSSNIIQHENILIGSNLENSEILRFNLSNGLTIDKVKLEEKFSSIKYDTKNNSLYLIRSGKVNKIDYSEKKLALKNLFDIGLSIDEFKIIDDLIMLRNFSGKSYIFDKEGNLLYSNFDYNLNNDINIGKTIYDKKRDTTYFRIGSSHYTEKLYKGILNTQGTYDSKVEFLDSTTDYRNKLELSLDNEKIFFGDKIYDIDSKFEEKDFDGVSDINIFYWDSDYFIYNEGYHVNKYIDILNSSYTIIKKLEYENEVVKVFKYLDKLYIVTKISSENKFKVYEEII